MIEFRADRGIIRLTQNDQYGDVIVSCGDKYVTVDSDEFSELCKMFLDNLNDKEGNTL